MIYKCKPLHLRRNALHSFGTSRPITRTELDQLRRALPFRDSLACAIMADTGLRISDVLAISRADLAQEMEIREQKTGKIRHIKLSNQTYQECLAYLRMHPHDKLIPCHRSTLWRAITQAADAFGWQHISPHSFRKLFAVEYCAQHGLKATQEELQHKHITTTLGYITDIKELAQSISSGSDK